MLLNQGKLDLAKMRSVIELRSAGIDLSTPSNEVAKMYDALLFQMYGLFDAPEVGGIRGCIETIRDIDPDCPLLRTFILEYGMQDLEEELVSVKAELRDQNNPLKSPGRKWTQFEKNQTQAMIYRLEGYDDLAVDVWNKQLAKNPHDIFSLKHALPTLIYLGSSSELRNFAGYVTKVMSKKDIFYPFVRSYEAYGVEEQGHLDLALTMAKESIEICPWNSWGAHTVAHVYDSQGKSDQGLDFLYTSRPKWSPCNLLSCHNNWHIAIFHFYNNDYDAALEIWDQEIFPRLNEQYSCFLMSDAVALLTRIEMEQCSRSSRRNKIDLSSRWSQLFDSISQTIDSETTQSFYDAHLALALMFCEKKDLFDKICNRIEEWVSKYENKVFDAWENESTSNIYSKEGFQCNRFAIRTQVLIPLLKALVFFRDREYQSAVNILHPRRYQLKSLGGSKAQNDLFHQILATTLLMARGEENVSFLKMLLFERQEQRAVDNYGERMQRRIIDNH